MAPPQPRSLAGLRVLAAALTLTFSAALTLAATPAAAPTVTPAGQAPATIFFIGHSLQADAPDMLASLRAADGGSIKWKEQFILGAPLRWQWEQVDRGAKDFEPHYQEGYWTALASGTYDTLCVTDSVPRGGSDLEAESIQALSRFAAFARRHNPAIRIWYYETWHDLRSGQQPGGDYDTVSPTRHLDWRARIDADRALWERIVDAANASLPRGADPIRIIPAGQALARIADAIDRGELPGFKTRRDLFDDTIHTNPYGKYAVACVHYAALFGRSPVGLPFDVVDRWGRRYWDTPNWQNRQWPPPNAAAVRRIQEIAWETVAGHPRTGVPAPAR